MEAAVKAVLKEHLPERWMARFSDEDYSRLASKGFYDVAAFQSVTKDDLKEVLPGRPGNVGILCKVFGSAAGLKFKVLHKRAAAVAASLRTDSYGVDKVGQVTIPVVRAVPERMEVISREWTQTIVSFISTCFEKRAPDMDNIALITGTPGSGRTTSVVCAFGQLYREFEAERTKEQVQEDQVRKRIVYMRGEEFVATPYATFLDALFLAYIDDESVLERLNFMTSFEELHDFVKYEVTDNIHIVLDDGNAMDDDETLKQRQRQEARRWIGRLSFLSNCRVIVCMSVSTKIRHELIHDKRPLHMFMNGGYTKTELKTYLEFIAKRIDMLRSPELKAQTGYVPKLVRHFLFPMLDKFDEVVKDYQTGLAAYISAVVNDKDKLDEMKDALAGLGVPPVPSCLDSRCFYRNNAGNAVCLAPALQSYARAYYTTNLQAATDEVAKEEVETWVSRVRADRNLARIGWNAEEAALLVFKLLRPVVPVQLPDVLLKFDPEVVASFKTFSWDLFTRHGTKKVLLIPENFNNLGVDLYYQDDKYRVVVQISVGRNAKKRHSRTVEVIDSAPSGGRAKLLLWVLADAKELVETSLDFKEVTVSFGQLHVTLADIDTTCTEVKRHKPEGYNDACTVCYQCPSESCNWVQCGGCDCWIHTVCAGLQTLEVPQYYCETCHDFCRW